MFRNGKFKKVLAFTVLMVLALSTITVAANEIYEKKLTATHGRIKFKVNGKDVTKEIESKYDSPAFTVKEYDSRSYVPVRAIAELMGMEIEWDSKTHTAEIIDVKSKEYEEELKKKDKEIDELKKEIEKLKKNVVEEKDLKDIQKKLNSDFGTYKDVYFDITLKESKDKITVDITIDLRDSKQESYWNRMNYNTRKTMVEDIVDTISSEFTNADISGSIYDKYYKKDVMTFSKKKGSSLSISYSSKATGSDDYIDDVVYDEFYEYGIEDAYISKINSDKKAIYFDIEFSDYYKSEWRKLKTRDIENILDRISDVIIREYDYYDDYYYNYRDRDIDARIYMDGKYQGSYYRDYDEKYGTFEE